MGEDMCINCQMHGFPCLNCAEYVYVGTKGPGYINGYAIILKDYDATVLDNIYTWIDSQTHEIEVTEFNSYMEFLQHSKQIKNDS